MQRGAGEYAFGEYRVALQWDYFRRQYESST
jgi:hypothetical protein